MQDKQNIAASIEYALGNNCFRIGSSALFEDYNDIDIVVETENLPVIQNILIDKGFKEVNIAKYFHIPLRNARLFRIKNSVDIIVCEEKEFKALKFSIERLKHMVDDYLGIFLRDKDNRVSLYESILSHTLEKGI